MAKSKEREFAPDAEYYALETKFHDLDFVLHSLYPTAACAKAIGQEWFDQMPYDRDGDGVRIRKGKLTREGFEYTSRVFWERRCNDVESVRKSVVAMREALKGG